MRWNATNYPEPMGRLPQRLRPHAIALANQLLAQGLDEAQAIAMAIERTQAWQEHRDEPGTQRDERGHSRTERGDEGQ